MLQNHFAQRWAITLIALALTAGPSAAHETDQYTLPVGREFADMGKYLTRYFYNALENGVEKQNKRIRSVADFGEDAKELKGAKTVDELAAAVNRQFPVAMLLIDNLDRRSLGDGMRRDNPGRITGYKPLTSGVRRHIDIPLNPFNAWMCSTIQAHGVVFGTDKIGHFTDMGMHYFRAFRKVKNAGGSDDAAFKAALELGTKNPIYSERGVLGLQTAGAYSNADLVANYMGFCFYRNLTEPVMLKGEIRPPMLVREGNYWKIADHVRPDSDFFSYFIPPHFDEAINPSLYRDHMRGAIRKAILAHRRDVIARFCDPNGNSWSAARFEQETRELFTYWGVDYGHWGNSGLMTVGRTCFAKPPKMDDPKSQNADGLTAMHYAAQQDDVKALERLIGMGADVNVRVEASGSAPAVNGDTPLHLAAKDGRLEAVKLLVARGADADAKNARGVTPLHMAVEFPQVASLLIDRGADVDTADATGRTPLHWAARNGLATAGLQVLLDHGARPQPTDRDGQTPLHDAARAAHSNAIVALIKGGADIDAPDKFGVTALHLAAATSGASVSDLLVRAGADVNARDTFGCTPLLVATRHGQTQVVAALLQRGADINAADAYGTTPLALASDRNYPSIAQLLKPPAAGDVQTAGGRIMGNAR